MSANNLTYYQAICNIQALYGKDPTPPEIPENLRKDIPTSSWVRLKHIAMDLDEMHDLDADPLG